MKLYDQIQPDNISSLFLYGVIMLANIDYASVTDYTVKAVIGGLVWFAFSLMQSYYSPKVKKYSKDQLEKETDEKNDK